MKNLYCFSRPLACLYVAFLFVIPHARGQVVPYLDSLLQQLQQQDPDLVDVQLLSRIALQYTDVDPVEGLRYSKEALRLATRSGDPIDQAGAYNALASNWLMMLEIDSALHYYATALPLYEQAGDKKGMGDITGNMGHAAYQIGRYDEALQYFFTSLNYFEEIGLKEGIINQHASLASTYMVQEKYDEAIHHDTIALRGFADLGDSLGYAMVLGNLANIHADLKEYDTAAAQYREASDIFGRANQPLGMGRNLINLAAMYNDLGQFVPALESAQKGLTICGDNNIDLCVRYCLSNMGLAYFKSYTHRDSTSGAYRLIPGEPKTLLQKAIYYYEQATVLSNKLESPRDALDLHEGLSLAYKLNGQYDKALEHHEIFAAIQDSLSSIERSERIEQLTTEREIAVRDKQIELDKLRLKVKRNERIYFIIGLALLAGWLGLVYRNALNQRRSNQQLGLLNAQISSANLQLEDRNEKLTLTLDELKSTQAQLIEAERQKENEILRRRISRDIHDDISSGLSKISWMTEILRQPSSPDEPPNPDILNRIASYSRETVSKLGEIIWSTKPESDSFSGLITYSREFLSRYLEGLPIRCHIDFPDDIPHSTLNPELRRNLYLVLKEAVHNAVKYSQASDLNIGLHVHDGTYRLVVEDNGIGMDVESPSLKGNGLRNMQGRMHDVRGTLAVHSSPGQGTRLEFSGPVF